MTTSTLFPGNRRAPRASQAGGQARAGRLTYAILAVTVLVSVFPLYWTLVAASTSNARINSTPPNLVPGGNLWHNLSAAFENVNMAKALGNSVIVAGSIAIGRPHSRSVSPSNLLVASIPIFEPRPATGEAKSR